MVVFQTVFLYVMLLVISFSFIRLLKMISHLIVHPLSSHAYSLACIYAHKNSYKDKIENQSANRSVKAFDISATNTFAKENTMVVIVINAQIAIITVVHVACHLTITFIAIIGPNALPRCFIISHISFRPIVLILFLSLL